VSNHIVTLDVRPDLEQGRSPFARILDRVRQLSEQEDLLLLAPFEPVPLFKVLAEHGFGYSAQRNESGDWQVLFSRGLPVAKEVERTAGTPVSLSANEMAWDLDARNLEPPEPMVRILETVGNLPKGVTLRASTDRRPIHLYAQLQERGFTGQSEEQPDGSYITFIRHCSR
jgi:uncharacterized protein (DUF2249 family)